MAPHPQPWHAYLTLDLLVHVLTNTLFHPFLAALLPLCLRALAASYSSPSFILTSAFAVSVSLYRVLSLANQKLAYGAPREVQWEEEVVVITGGVGGLGGCLAEIFALRGVGVGVLDVAVGGKNGEEGVGVGIGNGEEREGVRYYRCDVGDCEQIQRVWERITEELGTPTVLINNAAVVNAKPFLQLKREDVENTFRINAMSHFELSRLFVRGLLESGAGGTIVTVSSVLAHLGAGHLSAYAASKAALLAYHASLTAELAAMAPQVKTILVAPGQLDTRLFGNVEIRGWWRNFFGPVVGAGEVAVRIVEMLDQGKGGVVSEPVYARWIAWMQVLPMGMQRVLRGWSGVDSQFSQAEPVEDDKILDDGEESSRDEG